MQKFKEYLGLDPGGPFAAPTRELVARMRQALGTAIRFAQWVFDRLEYLVRTYGQGTISPLRRIVVS